MMDIITYRDQYRQQVIDLILQIQNEEAKINLQIDDQPDLLDIPAYYLANGGAFYLAVEGNELIGTLAFMNYGNGNAVLKKFFVKAGWRSRGIGSALYEILLRCMQERGFQVVLLDTPEVAQASHRFYERAGFQRIGRDALPFAYAYPDRDSRLYCLKLCKAQD